MVGSRLKLSWVIIHIPEERVTKADLVASVHFPGQKVLCLEK